MKCLGNFHRLAVVVLIMIALLCSISCTEDSHYEDYGYSLDFLWDQDIEPIVTAYDESNVCPQFDYELTFGQFVPVER